MNRCKYCGSMQVYVVEGTDAVNFKIPQQIKQITCYVCRSVLYANIKPIEVAK